MPKKNQPTKQYLLPCLHCCFNCLLQVWAAVGLKCLRSHFCPSPLSAWFVVLTQVGLFATLPDLSEELVMNVQWSHYDPRYIEVPPFLVPLTPHYLTAISNLTGLGINWILSSALKATILIRIKRNSLKNSLYIKYMLFHHFQNNNDSR